MDLGHQEAEAVSGAGAAVHHPVFPVGPLPAPPGCVHRQQQSVPVVPSWLHRRAGAWGR